MLRMTKVFGLAIGVAIGATACSDSPTAPVGENALEAVTGQSTNPGDSASPLSASVRPGSAELRVIHVSPDAPNVDVYLRRGVRGRVVAVIPNLAYGETTPYAGVRPGNYWVELRAAGAPAAGPPAFKVGPVKFGNRSRVTVLAAGLLGSSDPADSFRLLPLVEGFGPTAGTIRARIVHASPNAPTVAIDAGNDGSIEIPALVRFEDTGAAGVELPANTNLDVGILLSGSLAPVADFTLPGLPAGTEAFVIASGLVGGSPGFALLAVGPNGSLGFIAPN